MTKEKVFELIKELTKELLNTDIIMFPAGSVRKEEANKLENLVNILVEDKLEFMDIRDYRKSLL